MLQKNCVTLTIVTILVFSFLSPGCKSGAGSPAEQSLKAEQYLKSGDVKKAIECYKKAIAMAPDDPHYLRALALVYVSQGQIEEALPHLSKAISIDPDDEKQTIGGAMFREDYKGRLEINGAYILKDNLVQGETGSQFLSPEGR